MIRVSPKHGVNPSLSLCWFCHEGKNELVLAGALPGDAEAPRMAVWNKEPCDKCKDWMAKGVILMSVRDGETGGNPYRTGGWVVMKDEAVRRLVKPPELADAMCKQRAAFVEDKVWDAIGLPRASVASAVGQ